MSHFVPLDLSLLIHTLTPPAVFAGLGVCIALTLIFLRQWRAAFTFMVAFFGTTGIVWILKRVFVVPRPSDAVVVLTDYAFPSSHAALSMFLAVTLGWLLRRYSPLAKCYVTAIQVLLFFLAMIVGLSRLTLRVHTPVQVIVGFLLGGLVPLLVICGVDILIRRFQARRK